MTDLAKNNTPCGLMDPGNLKAMKAWPHGWLIYCEDGVWRDDPTPSWGKAYVFRAKPAPVAKTQTVYGHSYYKEGWFLTDKRGPHDTHSLTFLVTDGEPVPGTEKWERLDD